MAKNVNNKSRVDHVQTVTSEVEMRERIIRTLRERKEGTESALYLGKGAERYHSLSHSGYRSHVKELFKTYYPFLEKNILKQHKKIAFISMGCGNASPEKEMLKQIERSEHDVTYFGVDSSFSALDLARAELSEVDVSKHFLCADFGSAQFREEIRALTEGYDVRIYAFLGGTVSNMEPDYTADIMADVMEEGDFLCAEIGIRTDHTPVGDRKLYERYRDYLQIEEYKNFIFNSLDELHVSMSSGDFFVEMSKKEGLDALKFVIKFHLKEKVTIKHRGQRITFLPDTEVSLGTIIIFDPEGFQHFFEERDFKLKAKQLGANVGQFIFRYQGDETSEK